MNKLGQSLRYSVWKRNKIVSPFTERSKPFRPSNSEKLLELLVTADESTLTKDYAHWIDEALGGAPQRGPAWTESIAVGTKAFVERIKEKLGFKAARRKIPAKDSTGSVLREELEPYTAHLEGKMGTLRPENDYFFGLINNKFRQLIRSDP